MGDTRMNTLKAVGLLVLASGLVAPATPAAAQSPAAVQSYDGSKPLLCAMMAMWECDGTGQCERRPVESRNLPTFVIVDAVKRTLIGMGPSEERRTEITSSTRLDGRLILQGGDSGRAGARRSLRTRERWPLPSSITTSRSQFSVPAPRAETSRVSSLSR